MFNNLFIKNKHFIIKMHKIYFIYTVYKTGGTILIALTGLDKGIRIVFTAASHNLYTVILQVLLNEIQLQ